MNYASRITIESTTVAGVSFTLKKLNEKRRVTREMTVSPLRSRLIAEQKDLEELIARVMPPALLSAKEQEIEEAAPEGTAGDGIRALCKALQAERLKVRELRDGIPPPAAGELDQANANFDHLMNAEWYPAWIRWGLHSIDGLVIDEAPATVESLIEDGPPELVEEIFKAVQRAAGLSAAEMGNSEPRSSSADPADGRTSSSTATSAAPPNGTAKETASNIFPTT